MALHLVRCHVCGVSFEASRSDAETCSGRCRARASRERRERNLAAEVERTAALLRSLRAAASLTSDD